MVGKGGVVTAQELADRVGTALKLHNGGLLRSLSIETDAGAKVRLVVSKGGVVQSYSASAAKPAAKKEK